MWAQGAPKQQAAYFGVLFAYAARENDQSFADATKCYSKSIEVTTPSGLSDDELKEVAQSLQRQTKK